MAAQPSAIFASQSLQTSRRSQIHYLAFSSSCSSGDLPMPRTAMNLFSTSNQNGAPSEPASAVISKPPIFVVMLAAPRLQTS